MLIQVRVGLVELAVSLDKRQVDRLCTEASRGLYWTRRSSEGVEMPNGRGLVPDEGAVEDCAVIGGV
jgi:hypothetical protein